MKDRGYFIFFVFFCCEFILMNIFPIGNMRHSPARQFASQIVGGAGMAPLSHIYEMNENGFETPHPPQAVPLPPLGKAESHGG